MDPNKTDPGIELLRCLAALGVMGAHYALLLKADLGPLAFAITGVDLFFVITGYLFAPYFIAPTLTTVPQFALRRAFRIYPLYALALATFVGLRLLAGDAIRFVPEHLAFLFSWQTYEKAGYYNSAFWSLPVEVEFYVVIGLLIWRRLKLSQPQYLLLLCGALVLRGLVSAAMPMDRSQLTLPQVLHYHLPGMAAEFLLGGLVRIVLARGLLSGAGRAITGVLGLALWLAAAQVLRSHDDVGMVYGFLPAKGNVGLVAALSYALIMAGALSVRIPDGLARLAVHAGGASYAIYLWHNAAPLAMSLMGIGLTPVTMAIAGLLVILLSLVLHFVVEIPARDLGRRLARALDRPASPPDERVGA